MTNIHRLLKNGRRYVAQIIQNHALDSTIYKSNWCITYYRTLSYRHTTMSSHNPEFEAKIKEILSENSTKKFFIEHGGFRSNHLSHGIWALYKLNAPLEKVKDFIGFHTSKKLEPAEDHQDDKSDKSSIEELLGARKSYYRLYNHYEELLRERYSNSLEKLISGEFPKLSEGMCGSALHGMIHLGYGFPTGLPRLVCEGLAYLHYSNVRLKPKDCYPTIETLGKGNNDILDVMDLVRTDADWKEPMDKSMKLYTASGRVTSIFQTKMRILFSEKADDLLEYVHKIKFIEKFQGDQFQTPDTEELTAWLMDCAIIVYATSDRSNDFFLVHGVTCAWALKNILRLLSNPEDILEAARAFLCTLLATYVAQGCMTLHTDMITENDAASHTWDDIVSRSLNHEEFGEEHRYKLVQVCKERHDESTDDKMKNVYKLAAFTCVTKPLLFK